MGWERLRGETAGSSIESPIQVGDSHGCASGRAQEQYIRADSKCNIPWFLQQYSRFDRIEPAFASDWPEYAESQDDLTLEADRDKSPGSHGADLRF